MQAAHERACAKLKADQSSWTSHTVVVVDQSGSMRKTDVTGSASCADAVWLTLALDYVGKLLESAHASASDVISVVGMSINSKVLLDHKPMD
mmetsp:Transcript_19492/g.49566  ORF Transcript_19492/g.49566 Transcript_19492/m.49566 type:complete len:92 (+) Transcript_19492:551-826(+)